MLNLLRLYNRSETKFGNFTKRLALGAFLSLQIFIHSADSSFSQTMGDRVVCTINNTPYTQLDVEQYMNTREALRTDAEHSELVAASNWQIALEAFVKDMVVYQETLKTAGQRPAAAIIEKTWMRVKSTLDKSQRFKDRFTELELTENVIKDSLIRIIAIENIRKSREGVSKEKDKENRSMDWEREIQKTAVVRWYEEARTYKQLSHGPKRS